MRGIISPEDQYEVAKAKAEFARSLMIGALVARRFKDLVNIRFSQVDRR